MEMINKRAAYKALKHEAETHELSFSSEAYGRAARIIDQMPTIEAEPVRHGRWIDKGEYAVCTECGGRSGTQYDGVEPIALMARFCQNCGARMDGGV